MSVFKFTYPIEVRYGDLDPQGHVNNANFLTYFEQARVNYFIQLGLLNHQPSFLDIGFILADAHITFLAPVLFGMAAHVDARISRLGNKSFTMEYRLFDKDTGLELATGSAVLVSYDYHRQITIQIPEVWRNQISVFEGLEN